MNKNFKNISQDNITEAVLNLGEKPYRARQISNWIYRKHAASFDDMTDLSIELRDKLNKSAYISNLRLLKTRSSQDRTMKFLFELEDENTIESVLIPNNLGSDCYTLCISSQVGCSMGCVFCQTGKMGFKRNLVAHEIYDQVIAVQRHLKASSSTAGSTVTNIVFMGMGEPFKNLDEVISSLWTLTDRMEFSKRRITVSTSGIVPGFEKLALQGPGVNLAISLNATTDESRSLIMPVNKKYPIHKLMEACRRYPLKPNRKLTFEYVLLRDINDSKEDAYRLIRLLQGIKSKVNLIPYNPGHVSSNKLQDDQPLLKLKRPLQTRIALFQQIVQKAGIAAIIRQSKGSDISAACGQLKASYKSVNRE